MINDRAGLQVGAAGGADRRQTNLPRGGRCYHGSMITVAGAVSELHRSYSPFGRFLPELGSPADITLRRRGLSDLAHRRQTLFEIGTVARWPGSRIG
jgi:hypothetical protein